MEPTREEMIEACDDAAARFLSTEVTPASGDPPDLAVAAQAFFRHKGSLLEQAARALRLDADLRLRLAERVTKWKHSTGGLLKLWCESGCERYPRPMCGPCMAYNDAALELESLLSLAPDSERSGKANKEEDKHENR